MGNITMITERVHEVTIPDGTYLGIWSGNNIELELNGKAYDLTTDIGVKGFNIKVVVKIKGTSYTFEQLNN